MVLDASKVSRSVAAVVNCCLIYAAVISNLIVFSLQKNIRVKDTGKF